MGHRRSQRAGFSRGASSDGSVGQACAKDPGLEGAYWVQQPCKQCVRAARQQQCKVVQQQAELAVDELVLGQVEEEHQVQHQQVEAEAENAAKEGEGQEKGGCAGERLQLCFSRQICEGGTCPGYARRVGGTDCASLSAGTARVRP